MDNISNDLSPVIQLLMVMTSFSLLPFIFTCMTSFLRYIIVFSILKTAMGTQQVPPSVVIVGLSMMLTIHTMLPVFNQMYDAGYKPYQETGSMVVALKEGSRPLKEFMMKQTREADIKLFLKEAPETPEDINIFQVAPAYILSELKSAFEIGFLIFIPFIVLDLVVANVLLALGMMMLSPTIISLPFKLLMFIAVDGWDLIVNGLVKSYN